MFKVSGPTTVIATVTELKTKTKETVGAVQHGPVYIVRDGKPVAGLINMEMMAMLEEALEDRRLSRIAGARLDAIHQGDDDLLDEDAFWNAADARRGTASAKPRSKLRSVTR